MGGTKNSRTNYSHPGRLKSLLLRLHPKRLLHQAKLLKTWQLILLLIPLLFLIATLLRLNNIKMTELKKAVIAADEIGDDAQIAQSLQTLADFTFHHTIITTIESNGTEQIILGTGPIYLENQYRRHATAALEAAQATAGTDDNPNGNVYSKAMDVCKPQAIANGWAWNSQPYMNCMLTEIAKYPTTETINSPTPANLPSTSLYRLSYASPIWTFSLTTFLILLALILSLAIFIRFLIWLFLHLAVFILKHKK